MLLVERFHASILKANADGYVEGVKTGYVEALNEAIDNLTEIRDHWQKKLEPIENLEKQISEVQSKQQNQFNN